MEPIKESDIYTGMKVLIGYAYTEKDLLEDTIVFHKPLGSKGYYVTQMTGYMAKGNDDNIFLDDKENKAKALILGITIEPKWELP